MLQNFGRVIKTADSEAGAALGRTYVHFGVDKPGYPVVTAFYASQLAAGQTPQQIMSRALAEQAENIASFKGKHVRQCASTLCFDSRFARLSLDPSRNQVDVTSHGRFQLVVLQDPFCHLSLE